MLFFCTVFTLSDRTEILRVKGVGQDQALRGSGKLTMCEQIIPSAGTKASSVCLGGDDGIGIAIDQRCPARKGPMHTCAYESVSARVCMCNMLHLLTGCWMLVDITNPSTTTTTTTTHSRHVILPGHCSQQSCNALFKLSCSIIIVEIYELHCSRNSRMWYVGWGLCFLGFEGCLSIAHRQLNLRFVDYAVNPGF